MTDHGPRAQDRPSDEILNAFVDGEFSPEDRLNTLRRIASSERLSREICDMHQLKELVGMAYQEISTQDSDAARRCRLSGGRGRVAWFPSLAAGFVALVLGALAGYELTHDTDWAGHHAAAVGFADDSAGLAPQVAATHGSNQVLLHINDADTATMAELLDDIETMYRDAQAVGRDLNIQVVVHNEAMDLLRVDRAPYPERVATMAENYENLRFTACTQTLERLARAEGVANIEILPQAERIDSGVAEAARRQAEGWIYIKV